MNAQPAPLSAVDFRFLHSRHEKPLRYVWKAKGAEILAKIKLARQKMEAENAETL